MSATYADLLAGWPSAQADLGRALAELVAHAEALAQVRRDYIHRPGVTDSLRFSVDPAPAGRQRPLFHLIDVVFMGDEAALSVCFYADEVDDPQELGQVIPQGLFGENGYCFDVDDYDPELVEYLRRRQETAHRAAGGGRPA